MAVSSAKFGNNPAITNTSEPIRFGSKQRVSLAEPVTTVHFSGERDEQEAPAQGTGGEKLTPVAQAWHRLKSATPKALWAAEWSLIGLYKAPPIIGWVAFVPAVMNAIGAVKGLTGDPKATANKPPTQIKAAEVPHRILNGLMQTSILKLAGVGALGLLSHIPFVGVFLAIPATMLAVNMGGDFARGFEKPLNK